MRKRVLLLFLLLISIILCCACGRKSEGKSMQELPVITVGGVIYEPYFYQRIDGEYTGIDIELATEAFRRMGYRPVFLQLDLEQREQFLEDGRIDCIWSCLTMEERKEDYLWAGPYLYTRRVVVVPEESEIMQLSDLKHKSVAVQANSTSEAVFLNETATELSQVDQIYSYRTLGQAFTALRKGYVDAVAGHEAALLIYTQEYPDQYRYLNLSVERSKLGVAFSKEGDAALAEELTRTLHEMTEDGTVGEIIAKYGLDVEKNIYTEEITNEK